jgi:hypothetical protein
MRAPRARAERPAASRAASSGAACAARGPWPAALWLAVAVGLGLAPSACRREQGDETREVDPALARDLVRVRADRMNLRHDQVGQGEWATGATFVLVDVENTHGEDLMITLAGSLIDGGGQVVGTLRPASLRVPAGGVRTFALVDHEQQVRRAATGARVEVVGAHVPGYAPPVVITDGHVHSDGDRVVVTGLVRNTAEQGVRVIVLGGFHDARGVPLTRPFVDMYLAGNASHSLELVGPPGSVSGYAFIGDLAY